ncbi:CREB-regulated transcription coactivator 1-like isoform X2 [Chironomus tepperi]|uniref:CREB-regulated transcription coactivator 1-like isoform X2 n=1 Tax=Chironomus tepperi TaxID=113505 RepID=UPI00391F31FE
MANPRKFSEKIALLNQKEAEGNAEFERIMREVSEVSSKVSQAPRNTNLIATTSAFISRSLPNVNAPINNANNSNNIDNKNDEPNTTTLAGLLSSGYSSDITKNANAENKVTRESRGRSVGGGPMRSRRNIDTSPYGSNNNAYLSPPQESSWRRTSSDSAIHQSLTQAQEIHNNVQSLMLSPRAQKRLSSSQSNSMKNLHHQHQNNSMNQQHSHSQQNMQQTTLLAQQTLMQQQQNIPQQHLVMNNLQQDMKSRSVSRLPGIPIYPSQNDELLQIPVGSSTGSLPDLTLVHFQQSPLSNPLDPHELIAVTNQSYSMGSTNQTTTNHLPSMTHHHQQQQQQQQQQHQMYSQQMGNNLDQFSPKHFSNNKGSTSQGLLIQQQQGANNNQNFAQQQQQQSSPIPIDNTSQQQQSPLHYYTNSIPQEKMMSYRNNAASPGNLSLSQGNLSKVCVVEQNSYRSSPNSRPSPGSSPINHIPDLSNSSAPCSPSPQMTGNNGQFDSFSTADTFYLNPTIQQHFEQFSLMLTIKDWTSLVQSLVDSGCTISAEVKVDSPLNDYNNSTNDQTYTQLNDSYNGIINDSPNRTNQSPTNASRPNSRPNNMNQQTSNNNSNRQSSNNGGSSPHSPLGSDTMLSGNNYDTLRGIILGSSSPLDGGLSNGINNNSGVNDIMLGGLGSDSSSKLISSSSPALQNSLMMTSSPSHQITQTTTAIPEIVFSDYSSGSVCDLLNVDNFLELGMNTTELQMFENANIIDPTIEENFRRDLY